MIAQLTGALIRIEGGSVILDAGGIGFQVYTPTSTLNEMPEIGGKVTLLTHLAARVQPDFDMALYGFLEAQQLHVFKLLIGVSGVGAKVGIAMLSALSVDELSRAISTNDVKVVTKVPGVGPKLAQRLCLELGDKMAALAFEQKAERKEAGEQTAQENQVYEDVLEGLIGLGYSRADAKRAGDRIFASAADKKDVNKLLSSALQFLSSLKK